MIIVLKMVKLRISTNIGTRPSKILIGLIEVMIQLIYQVSPNLMATISVENYEKC